MSARARLAELAMSPAMVKLAAPLTARRVRHLGITIDTGHEAFGTYTRAELLWGIYERTECRYIQTYIAGSRSVIELGSGLGVSSAHIAACMAPGGSLICVEPNPAFIPAVRNNVERHARRAGVTAEVINAAIGSEPASMRLDVRPNPFESRMTSEASPGAITVATRSLRSIIVEHCAETFDLVADIEGGEAAFVLGNDTDVLECCNRLVIELHDGRHDGRPFTREDVLRALTGRLGFQVIERKGPVAALERIPARARRG